MTTPYSQTALGFYGTFNHHARNLSDPEEQWIREHFMIAVYASDTGTQPPTNVDFHSCTDISTGLLRGGDVSILEEWIADPNENPDGYDFDDVVLNFKEDVSYETNLGWKTVLGWDPGNPNSSATLISQSRVVAATGWPDLLVCDIDTEAYQEFAAYRINYYKNAMGLSGVHYDLMSWTPDGTPLD